MERKNLPIRYYSSVAAHKVDWLWYPYVPFGKITIIQGDPGDGKTTLVLNIAALLSNGTRSKCHRLLEYCARVVDA